ncbi:hypothetical protein ONS96_004584 [Cadophora gregata f. sp. sojae]|nr:hypothetical protein ONS96_004584 [Cadophora gregata f. sp. sojae]
MMFHPFSHLPTELRLLIWRATFPSNRSIYLNILTCNHPSRSAEALTFTAPVTLFINRESRCETLRFYHCQSNLDSFSSKSNNKTLINVREREPSCIYFNPRFDRVTVLQEHFLYRVPYNSWPAWKLHFMSTIEILHIEFREWFSSDRSIRQNMLAQMKHSTNFECSPDYVSLAKLCIFKSLKQAVLSFPGVMEEERMEDMKEWVSVVKCFLEDYSGCCMRGRHEIRKAVKVSVAFGKWKLGDFETKHLA